MYDFRIFLDWLKYNETFPNYEDNPILVHFTLKNNQIYVKKKKFFKNPENEDINKSIFKKISGNYEYEEEIYDGLKDYCESFDEVAFNLSSNSKETVCSFSGFENCINYSN